MNANPTRIKVSMGSLTVEIEGAEEFVQREWDFIKERIPLSQMAVAPLQLVTGPEVEGEVAVKPSQEKAPPLREFIAEKNPRGHAEIVTAFAWYLKTYRDTYEVSDVEIRPLYDQTKVRKPKYIKQALIDARNKKGFLDVGSKSGYYKVTDAGDNLVVYDLPREKKKKVI